MTEPRWEITIIIYKDTSCVKHSLQYHTKSASIVDSSRNGVLVLHWPAVNLADGFGLFLNHMCSDSSAIDWTNIDIIIVNNKTCNEWRRSFKPGQGLGIEELLKLISAVFLGKNYLPISFTNERDIAEIYQSTWNRWQKRNFH